MMAAEWRDGIEPLASEPTHHSKLSLTALTDSVDELSYCTALCYYRAFKCSSAFIKFIIFVR